MLAVADKAGFAERKLMEYWHGGGLLRLDIRCPYYLAPFLSFVGDELTEIGRQARKRGASQVGKPRLDLGVGEGRVDLPVELVDDLTRRVLGRAVTLPIGSLVARQEFAQAW